MSTTQLERAIQQVRAQTEHQLAQAEQQLATIRREPRPPGRAAPGEISGQPDSGRIPPDSKGTDLAIKWG